jgi:hypothetical protein
MLREEQVLGAFDAMGAHAALRPCANVAQSPYSQIPLQTSPDPANISSVWHPTRDNEARVRFGSGYHAIPHAYPP